MLSSRNLIFNHVMLSRPLSSVSSLEIELSPKYIRLASSLPFCRPRLTTFIRTSCRWHSRSTSQKGKPIYPERLLVYHVGAGKTTVVGCIKITTFMAFAFACLIAAPAFYTDPDSPWWASPAAVAVGAIPMIFVVSVTAPFVSTIHLRLPPEARMSKERMMRYTQMLPPGARVDMTAMRVMPWPKSVGTRVFELRPHKSIFSIADLQRVPQTQGGSARSWGFHQRKFYVGEKEGSKRSRAPGAWDNIMKQISTNSAK